MTDPVATAFLAALRDHLGQPDLVYLEPPEHLEGGYFTDNRAFRVDATATAWSGRMVLRLFPREAGEVPARREASVQSALHDQGFPAPRVAWWSDDPALLGKRFLVMEMLPGHTPMGGADA